MTTKAEGMTEKRETRRINRRKRRRSMMKLKAVQTLLYRIEVECQSACQ
jgi:hypothetical protein